MSTPTEQLNDQIQAWLLQISMNPPSRPDIRNTFLALTAVEQGVVYQHLLESELNSVGRDERQVDLLFDLGEPERPGNKLVWQCPRTVTMLKSAWQVTRHDPGYATEMLGCLREQFAVAQT